MLQYPMIYFDPEKEQLIYLKSKPSKEFWDSHWNIDSTIKKEIDGIKETFVSRFTKRYLKPDDGIILEGGCGKGHHVASLVRDGYECIGIDNAERTVNFLNQHVPQLDIRYGDVRRLPFDDGYFIGYWSLGVIEHFQEGYGSVASEISRVLQNDGYLFLSFPYMSPLRKIKSRMGLYKTHQNSIFDGFYQYILNSDRVVDDFCEHNFTLVEMHPWDGLKGTKDEIFFLKPLLQQLYDYKGRNEFIRNCKERMNNFFSLLAAHNVLLVFKRCER